MNQIGKFLIFAGIALVIVGALITLSAKIPWIGRLPGDIYVQKKNFSVYFPITTCIIISVILTLIALFINKR